MYVQCTFQCAEECSKDCSEDVLDMIGETSTTPSAPLQDVLHQQWDRLFGDYAERPPVSLLGVVVRRA